MAHYINEECIMCDVCVDICPENAIKPGTPLYQIDSRLCNDCGDCVKVCPVGACIPKDDD